MMYLNRSLFCIFLRFSSETGASEGLNVKFNSQFTVLQLYKMLSLFLTFFKLGLLYNSTHF